MIFARCKRVKILPWLSRARRFHSPSLLRAVRTTRILGTIVQVRALPGRMVSCLNHGWLGIYPPRVWHVLPIVATRPMRSVRRGEEMISAANRRECVGFRCATAWGCVAAWAVALAVLAIVGGGCSRAFYRRQADREVCNTTREDDRDPRWPLAGRVSIQPDPSSRMYDPGCPDMPPMPPDDPVSHQFMHCVDCKPGWPCWKCYGNTPFVENPAWKDSLPYNDKGEVVLDRDKAVELALIHSRDYQRELEDLYLSALDVTLQRFRFDAQFFGNNATFFTADGPGRAGSVGSELRTDTDLAMKKTFATGGELVVGAANSLVWQFAGPDDYQANT